MPGLQLKIPLSLKGEKDIRDSSEEARLLMKLNSIITTRLIAIVYKLVKAYAATEEAKSSTAKKRVTLSSHFVVKLAGAELEGEDREEVQEAKP